MTKNQIRNYEPDSKGGEKKEGRKKKKGEKKRRKEKRKKKTRTHKTAGQLSVGAWDWWLC